MDTAGLRLKLAVRRQRLPSKRCHNQNPMQNGTLLAAVDLGSNSFRLEIGELDHGQVHRTEYLKETVRQGNGLDADRNLTPDAMQRGWECLARFGERLAGFRPGQVRAVATQTLREARNRDEFLSRARKVLGFPIAGFPGREEARLSSQGVARMLPQSDERRLVIDIGGRSTELILGQAVEARTTESYRVGSVAWSRKYFPDGQLTREAFETAGIAAKAVLDEATDAYARSQWDVAYGASGTIGAVADILAASGFAAQLVTREGLDWLIDRMLRAQNTDRLRLDALKDDRRAVLGGGVSVLKALFDLLDSAEMQAAQGALRHGALYDLLDREQEKSDVRSATVERLAMRFEVDGAQARRIDRVAGELFARLRAGASDLDATEAARHQRELHWAARLHEIGTLISHSDAHKHGAYILDNADAPGFAVSELHQLSLLVLGHRGKLRKLETDWHDEAFAHQLLALRLAVLLCHARRDPDLAGLSLVTERGGARLTLRAGWAARWPQSAWLLREEVAAWQKTPFALRVDLG